MHNGLFFRLQSSIVYRMYLIATHLFVLLCVWSVLSLWLCLVFLLPWGFSFLYFWYRNQNISALEYCNKTEWVLHYADDTVARVVLLPSSVMMRYFLILHFKGTSMTQNEIIVLFPDSFSRNDFRLLRRCVRMGFL